MKKYIFSMLIIVLYICTLSSAKAEGEAWWTMNEGSGTVTVDSINSYTGTIQSATWTTDRFGYYGNALECGSGKWIDIPDSIKPTNITLCAWIFITGYDSSAAPIFSSETGSGASGFAWRLQVRSNHHLGFEAVAPFTTSGCRGAESPSPLDTGIWYHVAGTYDGRNVYLYLDGELISSNIYSTVVNLSTDVRIPSAIGHLQNWGVQWFRGSIDDARMYNNALQPDEIATIAAGKPVLSQFTIQTNTVSLSINNIPPGITNTILTTESLSSPNWSTGGLFCIQNDTTNGIQIPKTTDSCFYKIQAK